jgi:hypothetical protein
MVWLRNNGYDLFDADPQAEADWTEMVAQVGAMTLFPEADSWYMGANIPGKKRQLINFPSVSTYAAICGDVARDAYRGFAASTPANKDSAT